ncbi:MAG: diguanylate cyclase [Colwellia sp.]
MGTYKARPILFIILTLCFTPANAQENSSQTSTTEAEVANFSAREFLKQAESLRPSDRQRSIKLANKALQLSINNKNYRVNAQSHTLLGRLTQSKHVGQSMSHFLQASLIYEEINDQPNQIISSVDYVKILYIEKRYNEADKVIDDLLYQAQQNGDALPIAITLSAKGDGYYQRKHYDDAIVQYTHALKYLSNNGEAIQKRLADTYKKISQSHKHLENIEQTPFFLNKSLDISTALRDLNSMARTLNALAEAERKLGNFIIALDYSARSLDAYKQVNDPQGRVKALMGAGIIYRLIGHYEKSLKYINEAYLYHKKTNNINGIAKTSNQIGLLYTRLKQFDQGRSFYQLTIDLPEGEVEPQTLAAAYREMAVIDLNYSNYESAKVMAKKSLKIYQSENDISKQTILTRIIGNIYRAQKNDSQAIAYYRESLSLAIEIGNKIYQIKAQTPLARLLIGKNIDEATSLLKNSLKLSTQLNSKEQELYAYRVLLLAEKSRGNFAESLHYAEEEISLAQIIYNEKDNNDLIKAKAKLDSHKLEMELESLRERAKRDHLELVKQSQKIEISDQASRISELELTQKRYANIALASLLAICFFVVIYTYRRFVDSRKHNKELNYLATRDPLTDCYNRRALFDLLNQDFSDIQRLDEYCIIMADIDHFKSVNDTYGHSAGDVVLCGVANILQSVVRQNDIAARFGGEEFCIVLPGAPQDRAMRIAETMRQKLESSRFDDITITCSFGVTSIQFEAKTPTELIEQADLALYQSKNRGRNQVTLWNKVFCREVKNGFSQGI